MGAMTTRGRAQDATPDELEAIWARVSNWGRWGADDERGALNQQSAERCARAAALVREGLHLSLAHDLPLRPSPETPVPAQHHMLAGGDARDASGIPGYEASSDWVGTPVHGLGITHIDALCHMFVRGEMYNGVPAAEVRSSGARRNSLRATEGGVVGRGVLLDVPAACGADFLGAADAIGVEDLEAAERAQGVRVEPGDLLFVSTGRDARRRAAGGHLDPFREGLAGLEPGCLPWLHERGVAVLGGDGISDRMPARSTPGWPFPIHQIGITRIGLHLIDNAHLAPLAAACAQRRRWAFFCAVAPLRIPGGTGCPVNPVVVL
jgi:kynurenine formamidase